MKRSVGKVAAVAGKSVRYLLESLRGFDEAVRGKNGEYGTSLAQSRQLDADRRTGRQPRR